MARFTIFQSLKLVKYVRYIIFLLNVLASTLSIIRKCVLLLLKRVFCFSSHCTANTLCGNRIQRLNSINMTAQHWACPFIRFILKLSSFLSSVPSGHSPRGFFTNILSSLLPPTSDNLHLVYASKNVMSPKYFILLPSKPAGTDFLLLLSCFQ